MEPLPSTPRRRRGRAAALVAALSLVVAPLLVAPQASAAVVAAEAADEPAVSLTDVVAPPADQLVVEGTAQVGEDVAIDPRKDLWAPSDVELAFTYRWLADDAVVAEGPEPTLTLGPETAHATLGVEVTGTAAEGAVDGAASASVLVVAAGTVAEGELVAAAPTISGAAKVGQTLTAQAGTWSPAVTPTYRWLRGGTAISGATKPTYTLTAADLKATIAVEVTGTSPGYVPLTLTSEPTSAVVAAGLATGTPTISGTVRVGSKVTAMPGTWTAGTTLRYQWYVSGAKVSGATRSTYTLPSTAKGRTLTVKVTGTKTGYTTVTRTSAGTKVAAGVLSAPRPRIKGTVKVGSTVSVSRGTWKPGATTYRYQWKVGGRTIKGATRSTYTIPAKYAGKKLTVTVKGSRSGYTTRAVTSSSATVLRVYSKTSAPRISGTVRVGSTLKVSSKGTWSPAPKSWKYQWKANGTAIKGATRSSFRLTSAQHGKKITVTVSGVRPGYATKSRTSAATTKVAWPVGVSRPRVTNQPDARWAKTGQSVRFSASASGGRLKYQWQMRTAESGTWRNVSDRTSSSYAFTARSKHTLTDFRVRVSNVAGTVYSKPATLWVDSSKTDPYAPGKWFVGNFWMQTLWDTEAGTADGVPFVDAWFVGCSLGGPAVSIWDDLAISYVGSNGRTYRASAYPYATEDGCEQIIVEADGVSRSVAEGGVWKIVDHSGSSAYGSSTQWVRGLR